MAYEFYRFGSPQPCREINAQPPASVMTVPIVGVPRGGTTMVAAVAHALGLYIGPPKDLAQFTFEDQHMNRADMGLQLSYISKQNKEHNAWGWKDPVAISTVRSLFFALRNPRMIIVFRDILASLDGEMRFDAAHAINPPRTFQDIATATINWWQANIEFMNQTTFPVLLVSYERALHTPFLFIQQVAAFLGMTPTHEQLQEALARISPRGGYLCIDEQAHPIPIPEPSPEIALPAELPADPVDAT